MAHEEDRLKAHIEAAEESLKDNFEEIQDRIHDRVKSALDWKVWYKNNTAIALGGVAAGGLLLSLMIHRKPSIESKFMSSEGMYPAAEPNGQPSAIPKSHSRLHKVFDTTVAAVIGVASDQFREFMGRTIPGFKEHYREAERRYSD
jgi:hypothetical protein